MPKNMPKLGAVMIVAVIIAWVGVWVTPAFAQRARVEVSGQTECSDTAGNLIDSCTGTGQDGDIQAGVPFPTPRFTARKGAVKENLTGLIWLKNASCDALGPNENGTTTWQQALDAANGLANGQCGLSDGSAAGDWRLPNVKELQSLIDFGFGNPALSNAAGTAKWEEDNAFSGVQGVEESSEYWSSTSYERGEFFAWFVALHDGITNALPKDNAFLVWPVRGGQ
jgi:hypothetical protein